jgi:acyl carrier protein
METTVLEKLAEIIRENTGDTQEITAETTFEALGIDSLDIVEMVMQLEELYSISIELEEKMATVGELAAYIETKIAESHK